MQAFDLHVLTLYIKCCQKGCIVSTDTDPTIENLARLATTGLIKSWRIDTETTADCVRITDLSGRIYTLDRPELTAWLIGFEAGFCARRPITADDEFVPVSRAYEVIGCAQKTVYRMITRGDIPRPPGFNADRGPHQRGRPSTIGAQVGYTRAQWIQLATAAGVIDPQGRYVAPAPFQRAA